MDVADKRRKRPRTTRSQISHSNDSSSDARAVLAQYLMRAVAADHDCDSSSTIRSHRSQIESTAAHVAAIKELQQWFRMLITFQMQWRACRQLVDDTVVHITDRLDALIQSMSPEQKTSDETKLVQLQRDLPMIIRDATTALARCTTLTGDSHSKSATILAHQWLPPILLKIYSQVTQVERNKCSYSLAKSMDRLVGIVRNQNPYQFLHVLYRTPPATVNSRQWSLSPCPQTMDVLQLVASDFNILDQLAQWMQHPTRHPHYFRKSYEQLMRVTRRLAIGFHYVLLYLYAVAMGREPSGNEDAVSMVVRQRAQTEALFTSSTLQTTHYGLRLEATTDRLYQETFLYCPEVLLYVDQWRWERKVINFGFCRRYMHEYDTSNSYFFENPPWEDLRRHCQTVVSEWQWSSLYTLTSSSVEHLPVSFEALGQLETQIKSSIQEMMNLFYQINIIQWSSLLCHPHKKRRVEEWVMVDSSSLTIDIDNKKRINFQPPILVGLCPMPLVEEMVEVGETEILAWSDADIDKHEQEQEHLHTLQSNVLSNNQLLVLPDWISTSGLESWLTEEEIVLAQLKMWSHLSSRVGVAAAAGETVALHGAAGALVQRPSLRNSLK